MDIIYSTQGLEKYSSRRIERGLHAATRKLHHKLQIVSRKIRLGVQKLKGMANKVLEKTKKVLQPETETMTNNFCPI
jgi:hypothetical protein